MRPSRPPRRRRQPRRTQRPRPSSRQRSVANRLAGPGSLAKARIPPSLEVSYPANDSPDRARSRASVHGWFRGARTLEPDATDASEIALAKPVWACPPARPHSARRHSQRAVSSLNLPTLWVVDGRIQTRRRHERDDAGSHRQDSLPQCRLIATALRTPRSSSRLSRAVRAHPPTPPRLLHAFRAGMRADAQPAFGCYVPRLGDRDSATVLAVRPNARAERILRSPRRVAAASSRSSFAANPAEKDRGCTADEPPEAAAASTQCRGDRYIAPRSAT
jgi:hypothetical protein